MRRTRRSRPSPSRPSMGGGIPRPVQPVQSNTNRLQWLRKNKHRLLNKELNELERLENKKKPKLKEISYTIHPSYSAEVTEPNSKRNQDILIKRAIAFNKRKGKEIKVGDVIELPNGKKTRVAHVWDDGQIQTADGSGSIYLGNGYASYSGSLNSGVKKSQLTKTTKKSKERFWFFDRDFARGGGGIDVSFDVPVWKSKTNNVN